MGNIGMIGAHACSMECSDVQLEIDSTIPASVLQARPGNGLPYPFHFDCGRKVFRDQFDTLESQRVPNGGSDTGDITFHRMEERVKSLVCGKVGGYCQH
jgi:hypothetical protein